MATLFLTYPLIIFLLKHQLIVLPTRPLKLLLTIHLLNCLILPILHKIFDYYIYPLCLCEAVNSTFFTYYCCKTFVFLVYFFFINITFIFHKQKFCFASYVSVPPHHMYVLVLYCTCTHILTIVECPVFTKHQHLAKSRLYDGVLTVTRMPTGNTIRYAKPISADIYMQLIVLHTFDLKMDLLLAIQMHHNPSPTHNYFME